MTFIIHILCQICKHDYKFNDNRTSTFEEINNKDGVALNTVELKLKGKQTTRWVRGQFLTWRVTCRQHANIAVKTSRLIDCDCDIGCPLLRI